MSHTISDPSTPANQLKVNSDGSINVTGSSGSNPSVGTNGAAIPTSSTQIGFDSGGNLEPVSSSNPLPITGSISATNPSVGTTGTTAPTSATEIGIISGGNLVGVSSSNPVPVSGTVTASNPSVGTNGSAAPSSSTQMGFSSGGDLVNVSSSNPLPVSGTFSSGESVLNVVGNATSAAVLSNFPVNPTTGYRSAAIQVTSVGSGCTLVAEQSNDGTTWIGLQSITDTTVETTTPMAAIGLYVFNFTGLQFRVRCSVYGSGTPAVNAELRQVPVTAQDAALLTQINTTLGSPMQNSGGSVTANLGTLNGAATAALQTTGNAELVTINTTLGSPFQAGGNIGNTSFGATQATAANLNATVVTTGGATIAKDSSLTTINTTLGSPMQNSGGSVTANLGTLNGAATAANQTNVQSAPGTPQTIALTVQGNSAGVALPISALDTRPSSGTITAADVGSTTTTGQNSASIITGTPTANSFQSFAVNGSANAKIQISGTWSATLEFDVSNDGGTTWYPKSAKVVGTGYRQASVTGNGLFSLDCSDVTNIRVRATAYTSGTATILITWGVRATVVEINNPVSVWDNVNGTQAIIKPASTAIAATDTPLAVGIHPSSPLPAGTNVIGALSANQSVNLAQVNGVTTSTGAGATGTGSQRVGVAQDTTTIAGSAPGTAGTASSNVLSVQGVASMTALQVASASDLVTTPASDNLATGTASVTTNASTQLIPAVSGKSIWVTQLSLSNTSATTITVAVQDGSGGTTLGTFIVPAGGGSNNNGGGVPMFKTTSGNGLYFAASTGETTIYANASGFSR